MKIKQLSDLHLEFPDSGVELTRDGADVLILGGDICLASEMDKFVPFFEQAANIFPHVIYIAGNHEYYHGDWKFTYELMADALDHLPNVYIMDGTARKLGDVWFWAGTLWTDCNNRDPVTMNILSHDMNDYRLVEKDGYRLKPRDTVDEHLGQRAALAEFVHTMSDETIVVATHHAPSKLSTHPRYAGEYHMNGGYSSDLSELILAHPNIKLWTHGHTHSSFDYMVGQTRIVANPAGYPLSAFMRGKTGRENPKFDPKLTIELTDK